MPYLRERFRSWWNVVRFIAYFFSIGILLKTLFSGWRRDTASEREEWWQRLVLRGIFVVIGFIIRLVVLALALVALFCSFAFLPVLLIVPIRFRYERLVRFGSIGKSWAYGGTPTLHRYGVVLYRGADTKIYGRDETIDLMTRALARDDHNNVLLVGAPGSGRETLVAQFAKNVYRGLVPPALKNREVIEVRLENTAASILEKIFDEALKAGNIILVIRDPEKYEGILTRLEPLLSSKELGVIVITSLEGYHGVWKQRADMMRYFERVEVPPLGDEDTIKFLENLARERYGNVSFEPGVCKEIVRRTNELLPNVPQPEKSLTLLENLAVNATSVSMADVHRLLSEETGVPLGALEHDEKRILLRLEDALRAEIVGQEEAIRDIASALRRARAGVASREKPIGTFLFLGPTGSGKTHTGKMLAKHYFGDIGAMVRFDMSEFAIEESAAAFIERLAVSIEEQPFGLLFFDELEKAHRVVWNTLLQVLDEGRLSTETGRIVSFKNNIIIATSNAGTALIQQQSQTTKDELIQYLIRERFFSPEFLNRFDDIVVFRALSRQDAERVVRLLLAELNTRLLRERGVTVQVTDALVRALVAAGYNEEYGARALRRTIQDQVENRVAEMILKDQAVPGTALTIDRL